MNTVIPFQVVPTLPAQLKDLEEIAYNIAFDWSARARALFAQIGGDEWDASQHNPVRMLGRLSQKTLNEAAKDEGILSELQSVLQELRTYMTEPRWYQKSFGESGIPDLRIAYFSMEFGLTESIPNYSGGLGLLAGDHMKSASDLGLPLVGVGLLYQQGYFRQYLSADGWQQERYPDNDFHNMCLRLVRDPQGHPVTVEVEFPDGVLKAQIWKVQVGRVPIFLMDANLPENTPPMREVTLALYGGDMETRIRQEILLGVGGVRMLHKLNLPPVVCHMNEGHSAFLALERIRVSMEKFGIDFRTAREMTSAGNVFTTHTPVPAGIDIFPPGLMEKYFRSQAASLGVSWEEFMGFGRSNPANMEEPFNVAILALRHSSGANGVSRLHGDVSRRMWTNLWANLPADEVPISSITNGVHLPTWVSPEMKNLLNRYLGPRWMSEPDHPETWERVDRIPATELWLTQERARESLVSFCRQHLHQRWKGRGLSHGHLDLASEILEPSTLTIGFARRFATYKRATLLLQQPDRLIALLTNKERPLQLIFAGKAHPRDTEGKSFIRDLINFARQPAVRRRVVFLEDYDIEVARHLVQGVDLWLNNPRRPQEASGTSGMKVAANAALNLSVLDGWWAEGYRSDRGWSIGAGEEYQDAGYQDKVECDNLFDRLEQEIVPLFYDRSSDGIPRGWVEMMRASLKSLAPVFNTNRMVREYAERFYLPLARHRSYLISDNLAPARSLAVWKAKVREAWPRVQVRNITVDRNGVVSVGTPLQVGADVEIGPLGPTDVRVEVYHGSIDSSHRITEGKTTPMTVAGDLGNGTYRFQGEFTCDTAGSRGVAVRVLPNNPDLPQPLDLHLLTWG
ncbi:MAG: alpha-glucan phosphorylase [Candidatus Tectomicrobia bacterium RIFCSPLOWO2_12_FULL_69_37]|nr:MAG: alpha-glucan phosphorylase [Candidatus Tectomicrobia bacterium RIFCSPLOWO2_02_FULL_70_19]OGL66656.1 MAG: alpha-glucan phosphorylase [Candidatus Tectomicrobia bacterium RIFCSPLOWO2_12_FULL_69_37]